ncbi:hypothetical protein FDECE_2969 [Fusarium decemcellulare]|nr:hypothetical protein FDECE_2969 [Fusarium decemcellulare]
MNSLLRRSLKQKSSSEFFTVYQQPKRLGMATSDMSRPGAGRQQHKRNDGFTVEVGKSTEMGRDAPRNPATQALSVPALALPGAAPCMPPQGLLSSAQAAPISPLDTLIHSTTCISSPDDDPV